MSFNFSKIPTSAALATQTFQGLSSTELAEIKATGQATAETRPGNICCFILKIIFISFDFGRWNQILIEDDSSLTNSFSETYFSWNLTYLALLLKDESIKNMVKFLKNEHFFFMENCKFLWNLFFFFFNFFKPTRKCSAHEGLLDSHRNREAHQIVDRRPELAQILALVSANLQKSNFVDNQIQGALSLDLVFILPYFLLSKSDLIAIFFKVTLRVVFILTQLFPRSVKSGYLKVYCSLEWTRCRHWWMNASSEDWKIHFYYF